MITVNPKAGTLKQMSSILIKTLHDSISKVASLLLIVAVAFSIMSFSQSDNSDYYSDTNFAGKKDKSIETVKTLPDNSCCIVSKVNIPGINKAVYLSMPDHRTVANADREALRHFIASVRESLIRQLWAYPGAELIRVSDEDMISQFNLDHVSDAVLPGKSELATADAETDVEYARSMASHLSNPSSKYIAQADEEMTENFAIDNFKMANPSNEQLAKADADMTNDFEAVNNPKISMPSAELIAKADQEMIKMIPTAKQVKAGKSSKGSIAKTK
jgi:hypothetical protein